MSKANHLKEQDMGFTIQSCPGQGLVSNIFHGKLFAIFLCLVN